jgi:hypothetical protein
MKKETNKYAGRELTASIIIIYVYLSILSTDLKYRVELFPKLSPQI